MSIKQLVIALSLFFICASSALAVTTYKEKKMAADYDFEMCVARYANLCIDARCSYSEYRDCQDRCRQQAHAKCVVDADTYAG